MRLRQLATTQAIEFYVPPEVHQSILDTRSKNDKNNLDSRDVIRWLLEQTCLNIEQLQPLHYAQGVDFCRRTHAVLSNPQFLDNDVHRNDMLKDLRDQEHQTLLDLYKPKTKAMPLSAPLYYSPELRGYMKDLKKRKISFDDGGSAVHASALEEVEQEREVAVEVETVREVQKPPKYKALTFTGVHGDIARFAETGIVVLGSKAYMHLASALRMTSIGRRFLPSKIKYVTKLLVSKEFMRTVAVLEDQFLDASFLVSSFYIHSTSSSSSTLPKSSC